MLSAICFVSIIGAAIYYFYALNWLGIISTLILSILGTWLFVHRFLIKRKNSIDTEDIAEKFFPATKEPLNRKKRVIILLWLIPYLSLISLAVLFLIKNRTDASLTSPWQVAPAAFFIIYLLATGYLIWIITTKKSGTCWLLPIHYFLSFSVLWIIFKIGFGYDPFIHQATVGLIDKQGIVFPKTPYYLGQYSLILLTHKLFFIPIAWADKLLVPALAALTLPPAIYLFLKKRFSSPLATVNCQLSIISLLILPFSIFILTVPQNLAYLFLLLAIFFSLFATCQAEIALSFLLAGAAIAVHPIAGIPALFFAIAIWAGQSPWRKFIFLDRKIFFILIAAINSLALPILFYFTTKNNPTGGADTASSAWTWPNFIFPRQENIRLNLIYFFLSNQTIFLSILAVTVLIAIWFWRKKHRRLLLAALFFFSLVAAYFLVSRLNFSDLISYERGDYAQRILIDAFLFLVPAITLLFYRLAELIIDGETAVEYVWLAFIVILITISLYGSYPRIDNYYNSHSFSTGTDDLAAVEWIDQDSGGRPYIVLANQQVSVGALWLFGFNHYYKNDIFYYPIPTGGPLYQYYLKMVYEMPDRATAFKAADLAGVKLAYFVINKYWTDSDKLIERSKIDCDYFNAIDNGNIYIFKYLK
jgi:hypothetical protein